MVRIVKTFYTYFWNLCKIVKFSSFGKYSFIDKYLEVHKCKEGIINIGRKVRIGKYSRLSLYYDSKNTPEILIEDNVYIGNHFSIISSGKVMIEREALLASYITILGHNHGMNPESDVGYGGNKLISGDVLIGAGAWIGEHVCILPNVTIGKKSIIGAGSIVTKNIPDYCIAVGNPAKVIKKYNFELHSWESIM